MPSERVRFSEFCRFIAYKTTEGKTLPTQGLLLLLLVATILLLRCKNTSNSLNMYIFCTLRKFPLIVQYIWMFRL